MPANDGFLDQLPKELRAEVEKISKLLPEALPIFELVYQDGQNNGNSKRKALKTDVSGKLNDSNVIFELKDISCLSPVRKKLNMTISLDADFKPIIVFNKNNIAELIIKDLKDSVNYAVFLPFSEKKNLLYLYMRYQNPDGTNPDPVLLTMNKEVVLKQFKDASKVPPEATDFSECMEYMRKQAILTGFRISDPFSNSNGPPAFHVECHRGTKEGTLYFLPDHIIFGFKKPILTFDSNDIESITYSSITRLTFNVTLITKNQDKYEFSMIDQSEYAHIDEYVKRKQVKDKSMSDELKAKTTAKSQQAGEQSALKEATQQLKEQSSIKDIPLDSDDEEEDGNFEEGSSSDRSDEDSDSEDEHRDAEHDADDDNSEEDQQAQDQFEGPQDIPLIIDEDEEENDSDIIEADEDSGVEYH
ncbi:HBR282Cp [Eremothecium sinecaudum]|uniref:Histone chaperone RTT106 n=1 Tax=Eremothecium sinecaudum TaxID=45286 RepID=A0A109UX65_9SACH|nr:HBR282Cp [Eremothecium sinecaudum]AMD19183.1 HBR282Cp [Eremothecium sinecaudum]